MLVKEVKRCGKIGRNLLKDKSPEEKIETIIERPLQKACKTCVKKNIETVKELDGKINQILIETTSIRENLSKQYRECLVLYGKDYDSFDADQKMQLVALVNNTKSLSAMFEKTIA